MNFFEKAKDKFESWMDRVDGTDEFNELTAQQNASRQKLLDLINSKADPKTIEEALLAFQKQCFQDGFATGYTEGSMYNGTMDE